MNISARYAGAAMAPDLITVGIVVRGCRIKG
jgi:hypothetical protein